VYWDRVFFFSLALRDSSGIGRAASALSGSSGFLTSSLVRDVGFTSRSRARLPPLTFFGVSFDRPKTAVVVSSCLVRKCLFLFVGISFWLLRPSPRRRSAVSDLSVSRVCRAFFFTSYSRSGSLDPDVLNGTDLAPSLRPSFSAPTSYSI